MTHDEILDKFVRQAREDMVGARKMGDPRVVVQYAGTYEEPHTALVLLVEGTDAVREIIGMLREVEVRNQDRARAGGRGFVSCHRDL